MDTDLVSDEGPRSATILLVDDHEIFRKTLRDWVGIIFPGTRVLEATSGEEALAILENDVPHIILMDITLPGMNGLVATRKIISMHPSTHIVMLTVHDDASYRMHALAAGACAFVAKQAIRTDLGPSLATLLANFHIVGTKDPTQ